MSRLTMVGSYTPTLMRMIQSSSWLTNSSKKKLRRKISKTPKKRRKSPNKRRKGTV